jgi:hypothetical protein
MLVPTEFGSARNSRKRPALGVEIMLTLALERVRYFTMHLQVAEGSFLAIENVGTQRTPHELHTS